MAVLSKEEINLRRLLSCCEALANNIKLKDGKINWRLEKVSRFWLEINESRHQILIYQFSFV